ncbi:hypothetical protein BDQ17DRAFT_1325427 [Cyathus striatus]|nr:hypothetical protein BDQ17DRAFT_1325427 [Cyathus striatus]
MSSSAIPNYRMSKTQTQGPSFPSTVIEIRRKRHRGLRLTLTMKAETAQGKRPEAQTQESSVNSGSKSLEEPITGVPLGEFSLTNQTSTKTQWTCTFTTTWDCAQSLNPQHISRETYRDAPLVSIRDHLSTQS